MKAPVLRPGPSCLVSEGGLEPPRPFNKALAPQASASTYSATRTLLSSPSEGSPAAATQRNLACLL